MSLQSALEVAAGVQDGIPLESSRSLPSSAVASPAVAAALAAALVAFTVLVDLPGWRSYLPPDLDVPLFSGSDSFAHAHRVRSILERPGESVVFDRHFDHPHGTALDWPVGFDYLVAGALLLPARLAGGFSAVARALPFAQVALAIVTVLVFFFTARRKLGLWPGFAAAVCLAASGAFRTVSAVGGLDHHGLEVLATVLLLGLPWALEPAAPTRRAALYGLALAACAWGSTISGYLLVIYLGLIFAFDAPATLSIGVRQARAFAGSLLLSLCAAAIYEARARGGWLDVATLSLVQPGLVVLGMLLVALRRRGRGRLAVLVAVLVACAACVLAWQPIAWVLGFLGSFGSIFPHLREMQPLFMTPAGPSLSLVHSQFGLLYLVSPLVFLLLRRGGPGPTFALGLWLYLALFLLSFAQQRFTHLFAAAFVWGAFFFAARLGQPTRRRSVAALVFVSALLLEPFLVPGGAPPVGGPSPATKQTVEVARLIQRADPGGRGAVHAPPNMGNALVWLTRRPVVTNTFFYPRRFVFDRQVREAGDTTELVALLRERGIAFFVAADDARFRFMLHELFGDDAAARRWSKLQYQPCHPELLRFAYDRLACGVEESPSLELVGSLRFPGDERALLRRARVFRVR